MDITEINEHFRLLRFMETIRFLENIKREKLSVMIAENSRVRSSSTPPYVPSLYAKLVSPRSNNKPTPVVKAKSNK